MQRMKTHMKLGLAMWLLVAGIVQDATAFVLMGPPGPTETAAFNYVDDMGAPKDINRQTKRFFRWNIPDFTYSFDASFVNYFGPEGVDAVHEAFGAVNNFFVNEDYQGVSSMDLAKHGFSRNFNTTWVNTTAQNSQVIDIKSLVLGLVVNQIGLGNPHRWAFSIINTRTNTTGSSMVFETRLRNYDPLSYQETDMINNVKYSYRLIHDLQTIDIGAATPPTTADMEEFTSDQSGNAWSAVGAIADAFYGNTSMFWTDTPTLFNFGVYYDGMNAMGGQFSPRHALTYDDAGGLKYLYATNNYVYEDLAPSIVLVEPAQFLPSHMAANLANPSGRLFPFMPRQAGSQLGALPSIVTMTTPLRGYPGFPDGAGGTLPTGMVGEALRGGVDKLHFYYLPFDSLVGVNITPTNFIWTDTFIFSPTNANVINIADANNRQIGTMNTLAPGIQWQAQNPNTAGAQFWLQPQFDLKFLKQKVGRIVTVPDILFVCDDLGLSPDGVPIGWLRSPNTSIDFSGLNAGFITNTNAVGPGIFDLPGAPLVFQFTRLGQDFEVLWSGEASVIGMGVPLGPEIEEAPNAAAALLSRHQSGAESTLVAAGRRSLREVLADPKVHTTIAMDMDLPASELRHLRTEFRRDQPRSRRRWQFDLREEAVFGTGST